MKVIQDSNMKLKTKIAEIIDSYALNEKDYSKRNFKLRIGVDYLKDIGDNLTDLVKRYRDPDLILSILRPLDTLCFNKAHIPFLKQNDIVNRLLDFCDKPLNEKVTMFSLNLLIKFMENEEEDMRNKSLIGSQMGKSRGQAAIAFKKQLSMVITGLKGFLKNTKVTNDKQMLGVIFDLVNKVMANVDIFDEQMALVNLVNLYIVGGDSLDDEHLQKIIKINTILHTGNRDKYEGAVDAEFINYNIKLISSKLKSAEMNSLMAAFISSFSKLKTKPYDIRDLEAELLIAGTLFDVKTRLNIIRNFAKQPNNILVFLRKNLVVFLMHTLTDQEALVRSRSLDILKTLVETANKKSDVRASLRETCTRHPDVGIYDYCIKYLESITSVSRPTNSSPELDEELLKILKMVCMEKSLKDFQDIFIEVQNVEAFIKGLADKSPSREIRALFSIIYQQMYKNWTNDQRPDILDSKAPLKDETEDDKNNDRKQSTADKPTPQTKKDTHGTQGEEEDQGDEEGDEEGDDDDEDHNKKK